MDHLITFWWCGKRFGFRYTPNTMFPWLFTVQYLLLDDDETVLAFTGWTEEFPPLPCGLMKFGKISSLSKEQLSSMAQQTLKVFAQPPKE